MKLLKNLVIACALVASSIAFAQPVNINTADADALTTIKGIGPAKAQAIVVYRDEHGPFQSVSDLAQVRGIGMKTVEKNADLLTTGSAKQ